ncbi:MAG: RNA 2',3'-cyclic phosphodiesterase [Thermoleophilaceae bacterium]|nr:RNA 2',3'-cyclic phosphodiesterase [Thermoleophilaceae bacterium]
MGTARDPERERPTPRGRRGRLGSPRARLFVALELPDRTRRELALWRDHALGGRDDLRPVPEEALHVTLVFIGHRPEREIPEIARCVAGAVAELPAPTLRATRVTPVPPRAPRLFAVDLADGDGRAAALAEACALALAGGGFHEPERRPFWPHLTVARVKRDRRAAPLESAPPGEPFVASTVTLYRSHLSPRGARYEPLERFGLAS